MLRDRLLAKIRLPHTFIEVLEVMAMDSLDMTNDHRQQILTVAQSKCGEGSPIIVLHGTDSMEQTAMLFYESMEAWKVPVIFTGAMRPLGFENSDALQNIVEALLAAQILAPGVYISFHNHIFPLPNVVKDKALGTFTAKF